MKNKLIEVGYITDMNGNGWSAYAEHLTFDKYLEDVVVEGIELELQSNTGELLETLRCSSLSEMPDKFSQRQVEALENHILEEHRIAHQEYVKDLFLER